MKALGLSVLLLAASAPARAELSGAVEDVARPAYRVVETVTDQVYDALRSYFIGGVLPGRLSRGLESSPTGDSFGLFEKQFSRQQARGFERLRGDYPVVRPGDAASPSELRRWRDEVADEEMTVVVDSLRDALIERHRLEVFGRYTGDYARDSRNWEPDFLVPAGILGSAFLYVNGMHASGHVAGLSVGLDLRSGLRLRDALGGAAAPRLAGVELGYRDHPLKLTADWGLAAGRRPDERVGLRYSLRY